MYAFTFALMVFESNRDNHKTTTLFDRFSSLSRHGKGVSRHHRIDQKLFSHDVKNNGGSCVKIFGVKK